MFLYEELLHDPLHPKISEAIQVLLSILKVGMLRIVNYKQACVVKIGLCYVYKVSCNIY